MVPKGCAWLHMYCAHMYTQRPAQPAQGMAVDLRGSRDTRENEGGDEGRPDVWIGAPCKQRKAWGVGRSEADARL